MLIRRNWLQLAYGAATRLPGVVRARERFYRLTDPGTVSARYCYGVWMRHLLAAHRAGVGVPSKVIELGPGNSLGIGLAALLSGATEYAALDAVPRVTSAATRTVLHHLVELFRRRAPLPGSDQLPAVKPYLHTHAFPFHILDDATVDRATADDHVAQLCDAIDRLDAPPVRYLAPWSSMETRASLAGRADFIYSQAVLEHVPDIDTTYRALAAMLRPGGTMSHQIDYKHHGSGVTWNGHWAYGDRAWATLVGRRHYLINREPHSRHIAAMKSAGLQIVVEQPYYRTGGLARSQLAPRFRNLADADLHCAGAYVLAQRA